MRKHKPFVSLTFLVIFSIYQVSCAAYKIIPVKNDEFLVHLDEGIEENKYFIIHKTQSSIYLSNPEILENAISGIPAAVVEASLRTYDQRLFKPGFQSYLYTKYSPSNEVHLYVSEGVNINDPVLQIAFSEIESAEIYKEDDSYKILSITALSIISIILAVKYLPLNLPNFGFN